MMSTKMKIAMLVAFVAAGFLVYFLNEAIQELYLNDAVPVEMQVESSDGNDG